MQQITDIARARGLDLDALEAEALSDRFDRGLIAHCLIEKGAMTADAFTRLRCCVILKEIGHVEDAYHVLRGALESVRQHQDSVREFALICRRLGRQSEADEELARLLKEQEPIPSISRDLVFRSYFDQTSTSRTTKSLRRRLKRLRQRHSLQEVSPSEFDVFEDFAERVEPLVGAAVAFYRKRRFASPYEIVEAISTALAERRAFAFVRLGDGDGAMLAAQPVMDLFVEHRAYFLRRWFGAPELADDPAFLDLASGLSRRLSEADILGVPERTWLLHERDQRNVRTFMCCLALVNAAVLNGGQQIICNTSMHIDLAYRRLFEKLIRDADRVLIITSHADIVHRLSAHLGRNDIESLIIPPARSDLSETGYEEGPSHPNDAFLPMLESLASRAIAGMLVLVAAGFLGKIYCLEAKRAGAVAVDIGSVADLWMGFRTRPNFDGLEHLILPRPEVDGDHAASPEVTLTPNITD